MFVVLATFLAVVGGVTLAAVWAFRRSNRLPKNNPANFLARKLRDPQKKVVACIGASTVHAGISYNFVDELARRLGSKDYQFINAGMNGNSAEKVLGRLGEVIACEPDYAVVLVGGNDLSAIARTRIAAMNKQVEGVAQPSFGWYAKNLDAIIGQLQQRTHARLAIMSISPAGEDLGSPIMKQVDTLNETIRRVAHERHITYLPFNEQLVACLQKDPSHRKPFVDSPLPMLKSIMLRYIFHFSYDAISKSNGYLLLTDGMHINSKAGTIAAGQIETFVRSRPPPNAARN